MVKALDKKSKEEIVQAISEAEDLTSGEIRVHLEPKCRGDVLQKARRLFSRLKMHRTKERNGVLIYVALDSRKFALVGDSGIHARVGDEFWSRTRDIMASYFMKGLIKEGIIAGVGNAGERLKLYFPVKSRDANELPDTITGS